MDDIKEETTSGLTIEGNYYNPDCFLDHYDGITLGDHTVVKRGPHLKTICNWPFRKRLKFAWDIVRAKYRG